MVRVETGSGRRESWMRPTPADRSGLITIYGTLIWADGSRWVQTYYRGLADLFLVEGLR